MEALTLRVDPDLELVSARPEHAPALLALIQRNQTHIGRYLPKVTEIDSLAKAEAHVAHCLERGQARELFEFHVFDHSELCGIVRLNYFDWPNRKAAIAYLLDQAHGGKGIATRSVWTVLKHAFRELGLHRVELRCATTNTPSVHVAERLGFTREGELREVEWFDGSAENEFVFSLLRREFEAAASAIPPPGRS